MNYGIEEIEEFKAPSRKPWLVLLVAVVIGLSTWLIAKTWHDHKRKPAPAEERAKKRKVQRPPAKPSPDKTIGDSKRGPQEDKKKPPVDLKTAERPPPLKARNTAESISEAQKLIDKGDRVGARTILLAAIKSAGDEKAEEMLAAVNMDLAFLPYDMPEKVDHIVARGDSLDKISKKYGVTVESIQIGNGLKNPNLIKAGDHLRILDADFSIEVRKAAHDLTLLMNGEFFKRFKVGLGKFDKTPLGTFEVYDRIPEPVWWRPDGKEIPYGHEENILGTRWMAIRATGDTPPVRGYGIHGTWNEASIGKSESAGCVRMRNADVEQLFNLVPIGTKVTIQK